jgi:thymidylate kinase
MPRLAHRFIYLLGPEGVGKTTVANYLRWYIHEKLKRRVIIAEVRSKHLYSYIAWNLLIRLGRVEYYTYPGGVQIPRVDRCYMRRTIRSWLLLEFTFILVWILYKVSLPLLLGYVVICTRYVIDSIIDLLAYTLVAPRGRPLINRLLLPALLRLVPKQGFLIYLDADYNTLFHRYKKRGSYLEPPNWIAFYRRLSHKLISFLPNQRAIFIATDNKSPASLVSGLLRELQT